jgi:polyisoprenoid-binding protein YceI
MGKFMKRLTFFSIVALIAAGVVLSPAEGAPETPGAVEHTAPAGIYKLEPMHASFVFRIDHLSYSKYTASFSKFDATLEFDPDHPETMSVTATIDPASLTLINPPDGFFQTLMGPSWFNVSKFPEITFRSTRVELTSPTTAKVTGALTFLGVMAPLSFDVTFNGGYAGLAVYDPQARIGFSAHGLLNRTDWGMKEGLPPEGTNMGVGANVTFDIEAEFSGPPLEEGKAP